MFQIVAKAQKEDAYALQPLLPQLLQHLNTMVCTPFDENDALSTRNHNELLRCIEYLARQYVDSVIGFLLQRLDPNKKENTVHLRVGCLEIFKVIFFLFYFVKKKGNKSSLFFFQNSI